MNLRFLLLLLLATNVRGQSAALGGVKLSIDRYQGPATITAEPLDKFKLRLTVDRKGETLPIVARVELPGSGPNTWPAADVEVRDAAGKALLVRRSGIEWEKLMIPLPAGVSTCIVQAVEPPGGWPNATSPKDREIQDGASGARVRIANWHDGRTAALSIRFDDSHPTHLAKVIPILREYGFRGTFMVNPGPKEPGSRQNFTFETQRAEWEAVVKQGDQELANHSAHHRGANGDEAMETEIGSAAEAIWRLTPGKSKLMALNLGGGTQWETTRTLRYYLDKYHQVDASSGSLGMDDGYGGRVAAFRQMLEQHIARGLWCRIHYHYIGDGLSSSEANLRAALDIAKQHHDQLWIAGMIDIHKYQAERGAAKLSLVESGAKSLAIKVACATDSTLYDQPLTVEVMPPAVWSLQRITVKDGQGTLIRTTGGQADGAPILRFDAPPQEGTYSIGVHP